MEKTGSCLCGAVTYTLRDAPTETGACHCNMCRKWSGGVFLGFEAQPDTVTLSGEEHLIRYASSEWAERCSCSKCGSSLFYRLTMPGPMNGVYHIGFGTLDDTSGVTFAGEIFIDHKPEAYAFAGDAPRMTEAEFMAMVAPPPE